MGAASSRQVCGDLGVTLARAMVAWGIAGGCYCGSQAEPGANVTPASYTCKLHLKVTPESYTPDQSPALSGAA
ncbi:MAG: hypothetical protein GYB33_01215 [Gammaproteobacteria bacterium]|nr:hypothetical protein [Gammaproteobacteria bacterium]